MKKNNHSAFRFIKKLLAALGIAGLSLMSASMSTSTAFAELVATEDFGTTTSGNLAGGGDGIGWAAAWNTQLASAPAAEPQYATSATLFGSAANVFSHSTDSFGASPSSNSRFGRLLDTSGGGLAGVAGLIDESDNIGADGATVYIGFAMQTDSPNQFFGFELYRDGENGGARSIKISTDGDLNSEGARQLNLANVNHTTQDAVSDLNEDVNYYVLKLSFGAENADTASVFLNPTLNAVEGAADATITGGNYSFDRLGFGNFGAGASINFDDIRIGTTFADVVGAAAGTSGDFDGDEDVDGADFIEWQRNDGTVQGLADWQSGYGGAGPLSALATVAVPEPASAILLLFSVLGLAGLGRRS